MKARIKKIFMQFIILSSLVFPYSFTIITTDISFKQEVSDINSEFKSTTYKSSDSLLSEFNDDVEESSLLSFFVFGICNRKEYISLSFPETFLLPQKIPFKLLSIPPPSI